MQWRLSDEEHRETQRTPTQSISTPMTPTQAARWTALAFQRRTQVADWARRLATSRLPGEPLDDLLFATQLEMTPEQWAEVAVREP